MKIENQTRWRTDQLAALLYRVAQEELDPAARKALVVRVQYRRRNSWIAGRAFTSGPPRVRLFLSRHTAPDPVDLAMTASHEMAHTRGMRHPGMRGSKYDWRLPERMSFYAWAATYPIDLTPAKPKQSREAIVEAKLGATEARLADWRRKLRLATTKVRKYQQRLRALEQRAAAMRQPRDSPSLTEG